jgi:hypothetical protein
MELEWRGIYVAHANTNSDLDENGTAEANFMLVNMLLERVSRGPGVGGLSRVSARSVS